MNIISAVIRRYLPFSPTYEADDCIVVILSLFCIECAWSQPLNRTFCQSPQLGTGLHCQFSRRLDRCKAQPRLARLISVVVVIIMLIVTAGVVGGGGVVVCCNS